MSKHPRLLFGGAAIGMSPYATVASVSDLLKTLQSMGIDKIDTAPRYPFDNHGASESLLGQTDAIAQGFLVDTKIYHDGGTGAGSLEPAAVEASLAASCRRLGVDPSSKGKIKVLYCHGPDHETPLEEQAAGLHAVYETGVFAEVFQITSFS